MKDNLSQQFHQLTMFQKAGVLADPDETYHMDRWRGGESADTPYSELKDLKLDRAQEEGTSSGDWLPKPEDPSLMDSIRRHGVKEPVDMMVPGENEGKGKPVLLDGHHRTFAANEIDPRMEVPQTWHSDRMDDWS
jgi:hypothetical protein